MCSYREKKSEPTEMMQLDGYTVDYIEAVSGIFCIVCIDKCYKMLYWTWYETFRVLVLDLYVGLFRSLCLSEYVSWGT